MKTILESYLESLPENAREYAEAMLAGRRECDLSLTKSEKAAIRSALTEIKRNYPEEKTVRTRLNCVGGPGCKVSLPEVIP